MIVCQCKGVTDTTIRRLAAEGADTLRAIQMCTGAARCCAPCRVEVCRILREESGRRQPPGESSGMQSAAA